MSEIVSSAVQIAVTVLLLVGVGALLAHIKWGGEAVSDFLVRAVTRVGLPGMVISYLNLKFPTSHSLMEMFRLLPVPFLVQLLSFGIGYFLAKLCRLPKNRYGVFMVLIAFSNTVFIGIPVCQTLFGDAGIQHALTYYIANTLLFWSLGVLFLAKDGKGKLNFKSSVKAILSPAIISIVLVMSQIALGIKLPKPILQAAGYLGNLCTPLSLIFIGMMLYKAFSKGFHWYRGMTMTLLGRLALAPALAFFLCMLFPVGKVPTEVFMVQAGLPAMSQIPLVARAYGSDESFASASTALSTILCLAALPLMRMIQQMLHLG